MLSILNITPTRILDALLAVTLVLAAGRMMLFFAHQPVIRRRICICTLCGCLLAAPLALTPALPRVHLGLINDSHLLLNNPAGDVGLVPGGGSALNADSQHYSATKMAARQQNSALLWRMIFRIYLLGAALMLTRLLLGFWLVRRHIRLAQEPQSDIAALWRAKENDTSNTRLLISRTLARPVTAGLFRPAVIIPESLCAAEKRDILNAVLLHELAHARRRDTAACLLGAVTHVVLFFHPLIWWLRRDMRQAQEFLADAWAAEKLGSAEQYVNQFVELARISRGPAAIMLPVMDAIRKQGEFYRRMKKVLLSNGKIETRCRRGVTLTVTMLMILSISAGALTIGSKSFPSDMPAALREHPLEARGIQFLLAQQEPGGGWLTHTGPGVTALVVKALLRAGYSPDSPAVARALTYIESTQQPDGGFYRSAYPSYNTAIVVSTLAMLPNAHYQKHIERAHGFIQAMRKFAEAQNRAASTQVDDFYQAATEVEALRDSGLPATDPGVRAAYKQMAVAAMASGERSDQLQLPRYGAMTYAELKSLLYAGLSHDDPRVRGILTCIREYYSLDYNPGDDSHRGQFYFYHALAKALRAYGSDVIVDSRGISHAWKTELNNKLTELQLANGSWVNSKAQDYLENNPVLVTTYCVMALQEIR